MVSFTLDLHTLGCIMLVLAGVISIILALTFKSVWCSDKAPEKKTSKASVVVSKQNGLNRIWRRK